MSIKLLEHKTLLLLLGKIEDEIAQLEDPFNKNLPAYKSYMQLLTSTMELLNSTINIEIKEFDDENFKALNDQFEAIKQIFHN